MARSNIQIKVGTYTGNGVDATTISGVGFRPAFVIIKGGANVAAYRTNAMSRDSTSLLSNVANVTGGVQEFLNDGFLLGTAAQVNANGTTYYYIALGGNTAQNYFKTGRYVGSGTDNRAYTVGGINFTPDILLLKGDSTQVPPMRIASIAGDLTTHLAGAIDGADEIQDLRANGFQLGSSARSNASTVNFYFTALKHLSGVIASGTYTGDGTVGRKITGLGFAPDFVLIKNGSTTNSPIIRTTNFSGDSSISLGAATATTNQIQSNNADGFTVGSSTGSNGTGNTFYWWAIKSGNYSAPVSRTVV